MRIATALVFLTLMAGVGSAQQQQPAEQKTPLNSERVWVGDPVSMSLKDGQISEVLRSFAREFGLNIVIREGVGGPITVELNQVPWDQALDGILRVNRLIGERADGVLVVRPVEQGEKSGLADEAK